jgi:hypothetical protein
MPTSRRRLRRSWLVKTVVPIPGHIDVGFIPLCLRALIVFPKDLAASPTYTLDLFPTCTCHCGNLRTNGRRSRHPWTSRLDPHACELITTDGDVSAEGETAIFPGLFQHKLVDELLSLCDNIVFLAILKDELQLALPVNVGRSQQKQVERYLSLPRLITLVLESIF